MSFAITAITGLPAIPEATAPSFASQAAPAGSFAAELANAVGRVEKSLQQSDAITKTMLQGESVDLHQVALRAQEAQLQFEMFLQVRNKLIQGYQEMMRMQV